MTSKERVNIALSMQEPDRVPIFVTIVEPLAESLSKQLGIPVFTVADSPVSKDRISYPELLVPLGNDVVAIGACAPDAAPTREVAPGVTEDEWQIKYRRIGFYSEMVEHPLSHVTTRREVARYSFPDPTASGRYRLARSVASRHAQQFALCGDLECTILEGAWHLVGFEKFIVDLYEERDYVFGLMDRMAEYSIGVGRELLNIGVDLLWLGDDVGMQSGMMLDPAVWRRHVKDRLAGVIADLKGVQPTVKIAYHSCGSYEPIIPDLIEIGVDVLNALQPTAKDMELAPLKRRYGREVCFFGGVDTQAALPFGTLDDVEKEVRRVLVEGGIGGGLILAGAHNLQPDVSVEKVLKVFETAREHGEYPISIRR